MKCFASPKKMNFARGSWERLYWSLLNCFLKNKYKFAGQKSQRESIPARFRVTKTWQVMRYPWKRCVLWSTCQVVGSGNGKERGLEGSIRKGGSSSKVELDFSVFCIRLQCLVISPLGSRKPRNILKDETRLDGYFRVQIQTMMQKMNENKETLMA